MLRPALVRQQDNVARSDQIGNERLGSIKRQVLAHLERDREIKAPRDFKLLDQVNDLEMALIEHCLAVDVSAVDPQQILDPALSSCLQPRSQTTANVDDAVRLVALQKNGQHDLGRRELPLALIIVKGFVVGHLNPV